LQRFSVSMEKELLEMFDHYLAERKYSNRSEAVRDLIRKAFVREEWDRDAIVIGVVTLVYDHHMSLLHDRLTELQHKYYHLITSSTHVHMDHDNCLEVTIVKGKASQVQELADQLIALRGVKDGKLTMSSTGGHLH